MIPEQLIQAYHYLERIVDYSINRAIRVIPSGKEPGTPASAIINGAIDEVGLYIDSQRGLGFRDCYEALGLLKKLRGVLS